MGAGKAVAVGILYAVVFIAIPMAFISVISGMLESNGLDPSEYFHGTSEYVLLFGSLLSVSAAITAYFGKGSKARLVAGITSSLFLILWGYFFIDSMSIFYQGDTYSYEVLVPGIATILAISFSFRLIYRIVEFAVYRNEYSASPATPTSESGPGPAVPCDNEDDGNRYF